jgi:hypothetical protein
MKGIEVVQKVIEQFGTRDGLVIAEKSGVKIIYQNWHPVTVGEFDKKTKTICVNLRALTNKNMTRESIIAHELGHFFAMSFNFDRKTEESFAIAFGEELIK